MDSVAHFVNADVVELLDKFLEVKALQADLKKHNVTDIQDSTLMSIAHKHKALQILGFN